MSKLKTCPVCKATCFADMETCYGCLHRFGDDEKGSEVDFEPEQPNRLPDFDSKSKLAEKNVAVPRSRKETGHSAGDGFYELEILVKLPRNLLGDLARAKLIDDVDAWINDGSETRLVA